MEEIKQVPYGVSDFVTVRERNLYYVDKTMYLSLLEQQPDSLFYIRPRRFGKSLFISMLQAYYDKAMSDRFDSLFGGLWVHEHPTPLRGRYQMLYLDFSQVGGDIDQISTHFEEYCKVKLDGFMRKYQNEYPEVVVKAFFEIQTVSGKLALIRDNAGALRIPLYLIIDEYDNFTNIVLNEKGEEVYHAITHASGFNIGWHLSMNPKFDKMLGFSTEDVRAMLLYYKEVGMLPAESDVEVMLTEMKPWYDNYCFAKECLKQDARVFNCDMVLYYIRQYMDSGHSPERMVDPNTKTDYNKLKKLLQLDRLDGDRRGVIRRIVEEGQIITEVEESFPAKDLTNPNIFPSLLFYYGMLTIKGTYGSQLILCIPNNNVRKQYYEYLLEGYNEYSGIRISSLLTLFTRMSFDGQWREALQYIADAYKNLSSVRDSIEGERSIQGFFMAYLSLNDYYITAPELELSHGYCDFFLLPNLTHYQSKHSYIVELKYLPKKDFEAKAAEQWQQAVEQIDSYARAPRVEALRQGTQMHKIVMQFSGWDLMRMEEV